MERAQSKASFEGGTRNKKFEKYRRRVSGLDKIDLCCTLVAVMIKALIIAEYVLSILLVLAIMLQHRGTGLGGVFASEANAYRSKRGIEKFLFNSTIVFASLLVVSSIVHLFIRINSL